MPLAKALALALASLGGLQSRWLVAATVIAATVAVAAFAPAFRVAILALWRCIRAHCCSHGGLVGQGLVLLCSIALDTLTTTRLTRLTTLPATTLATA